MGIEVFVTMWWLWPLLHYGGSRLQIQHVSHYYRTYIFSTYFLPLLRRTYTLAYFGASLMYFTCLFLCYIMSNLKLYSNITRRTNLFTCYQPELCRQPQRIRFLKTSIKIKSFSPVQLWYTTSNLNGDIQECMHFLLLNLILLGMMNTFHM